MTMLDVLSLVVACVAIAFGVISAVRARTAAEVAAEARTLADRAGEAASAARADAAAAAEQAREARADAANALDQATRAQAEATSTRESAAAALRAAESARADAINMRDASDASLPAAPGGAVRWKLEHAKGTIWVMKNDGDAAAQSALLSDVTQPPKYIRPDEVIPRTVDPGDHLQFRASPQRGGPPPRVRVSWRDGDKSEPKSKDVTLLVED